MKERVIGQESVDGTKQAQRFGEILSFILRLSDTSSSGR